MLRIAQFALDISGLIFVSCMFASNHDINGLARAPYPTAPERLDPDQQGASLHPPPQLQPPTSETAHAGEPTPPSIVPRAWVVDGYDFIIVMVRSNGPVSDQSALPSPSESAPSIMGTVLHKCTWSSYVPGVGKYKRGDVYSVLQSEGAGQTKYSTCPSYCPGIVHADLVSVTIR